MKLFTKYTRINLLVMVIVFLLSAASTYLLTNYVLIREMDADLSGIRDRLIGLLCTISPTTRRPRAG